MFGRFVWSALERLRVQAHELFTHPGGHREVPDAIRCWLHPNNDGGVREGTAGRVALLSLGASRGDGDHQQRTGCASREAGGLRLHLALQGQYEEIMPDWPQYHRWGKERPGQLRAAGTLGPERRPPDPRGQRPMDQIVVVPLTSLPTSSNGDFVGLSLARTKSTRRSPRPRSPARRFSEGGRAGRRTPVRYVPPVPSCRRARRRLQ